MLAVQSGAVNARLHQAGAAALDEGWALVCAGSGATASSAASPAWSCHLL